MSEVDDKAIRVIVFSGKASEWPVWEAKFLAKASRKGYKKLLIGTEKAPPDSETLKESDVDQLRLRRANEMAYEELLLSIDGTKSSGRVAFNIVKLAKTDELPEGDAALAWKRLVNKYATKSAPSLMALKSEFTNSKLKSKKHDPDEWLTELEDLRMRIDEQTGENGSKMTDMDFMIHVLNNLPPEYEIVQAKLEELLSNNELTVDKIRTELNLKFQRMSPKHKQGRDNESENEETALVGFKGECRKCGKYGHKAVNCRQKDNNKDNNSKSSNSNSNNKNEKGKGFSGKCNYCGIRGHKEEKCWKKHGKPDDAANMANNDDNKDRAEVILTAKEVALDAGKPLKITEDIWIGDSGASCHMTNDDTGMFDCTKIDEDITIGNGKPMKATKLGKIQAEIIQQDGSTRQVTLTNVKYIPELWCKLFSITAALGKGFNIGNEKQTIFLQKGDVKLVFDHTFQTKTGFILGIEMKQRSNDMAQANLQAGREININVLHQRMGHANEDTIRKTAAAMGVKVIGNFMKCEDCAFGKARQKNLNKNPVPRSETKGERLFIDIAPISSESYGGAKYWLLVIDDATDHCWSYFLKKREETSDVVRKLIKNLKAENNVQVKSIRCDGSGENKRLRTDCERENLGIHFEFTTRETPQHNGRAERKYASLFGRIRSMLNGARVTKEMRQKLWAEAARTATMYENMLITDLKNTSSHKAFYGQDTKYFRHLRTFGEICVMATRDKIKGKLEDRGKPCMFLGYSDEHTGEAFRLLNLETTKVVMSRDVIWLNKNYATWKGIRDVHTTILEKTDDDDDDDYDDKVEVISKEAINPRANDRSNAPPNQRIIRELRNLQFDVNGGNPVADEKINELQGMNNSDSDPIGTAQNDSETGREMASMMFPNISVQEFSFIARETVLSNMENKKNETEVSDVQEPTTFREAWDHPDPIQRKKWREALHKEFRDMINRGVWRNIKKTQVPKGRRCVKSKWVFKIKRNGVFRARLVACGYSQVPGVDFTENYSPVVNDVTFRIMLVAMILWNLDAVLIDVETAFLHGELEEDIYMECPDGMENVNRDEDCLHLRRCIYGLVQSARQYWKKFVAILRDIGFKGGSADPCLMTKQDELGIVMLGIYVDDCLCIGNKAAIDKVIKDLQDKGLTLKVEREMKDYLSCEIIKAKDGKSAILHQPHIIASIEKQFGAMVKDLPTYKTSGTPGLGMIRNEEGPSISAEQQSLYRSGVGKLLYLVKHSRPDIANAVRELSKVLDCASDASMKELLRVVKYVLDTKNYGLKIAPVKSEQSGKLLSLVGFCDSDYAGDKQTRLSISGFIIFLCGVPIAWRSKAQRSVSLSSSEAEFVSLSEAAKEVKFIAQVIESMGIKVQKPITVYIDNIGAKFMAYNVTTSQRTKHVDIRYHYVREFIQDGFLEVKFVKTTENVSDGFTKNLNGELYDKHKKSFIQDKETLNEEQKEKVID